jgi:hypothetical protein
VRRSCFLLISGAEERTIYLLRALAPLILFAIGLDRYVSIFFASYARTLKCCMAIQSKQFVPKYLVDLSRACLAFATWPIFVCSVAMACHLKQVQRSILKSRWAGGQYIYTGICIPSPHTRTRPH